MKSLIAVIKRCDPKIMTDATWSSVPSKDLLLRCLELYSSALEKPATRSGFCWEIIDLFPDYEASVKISILFSIFNTLNFLLALAHHAFRHWRERDRRKTSRRSTLRRWIWKLVWQDRSVGSVCCNASRVQRGWIEESSNQVLQRRRKRNWCPSKG